MACASAVISAKRACASFAVHVFNGIAHILATTVPGELVNITPTSKAGNTVLREEYTSQCDVGLAIFELIGMSITSVGSSRARPRRQLLVHHYAAAACSAASFFSFAMMVSNSDRKSTRLNSSP